MSITRFTLRGLYAITDTHMEEDEQLLSACQQAISGGARILQYRSKTLNGAAQQRQGEKLLALCRTAGIPLIINDNVELATKIGADGVHLGRDDGNIAHARDKLGSGIIGISCYNERQLAEQAVAGGADYIAFGAFFASQTKPNAVTASPDLLTWAKRELNTPVVAIGGVTPRNGHALVEAGADMVAVIQGVFGQADIRAAAQDYAKLFSGSPD